MEKLICLSALICFGSIASLSCLMPAQAGLPYTEAKKALEATDGCYLVNQGNDHWTTVQECDEL